MKIKINEEQYSKLINSLQEAENQINQQPDNSEDEKSNSKAMIDAIVNDPTMKQAFYKKPTLWNAIGSFFKGEEPKGTGIVPANDILKKYGLTRISKSVASIIKNFNFGRPLTYTLISDNIVFDDSNKAVFESGKKYNAIVSEPRFGDKYLVLIDGLSKVKIFIKNKNEKQLGRNVFDVIFTKIVNDSKGQLIKQHVKGVIILNSKKGSGYYDYKR